MLASEGQGSQRLHGSRYFRCHGYLAHVARMRVKPPLNQRARGNGRPVIWQDSAIANVGPSQ